MPGNIRTPLTAQDLLDFHECLVDLGSRQLAQHFANYIERKATNQNTNTDDEAMFAPFEYTVNHVCRKLDNDVAKQIIDDIKCNNGLIIEEIVKNYDFQLLKKALESQMQLDSSLPVTPLVTTETSNSTKPLLAQLPRNLYEEITRLDNVDNNGNGKAKYQKVKLIFWCINMGASEQAIIDKIQSKLSELFLDRNIQIEIEARFFYGSSLLSDKGLHKAIIEDNKIFEEYGIAIEQLKHAVAYEPEKNDNLLELRILFSQTASCGSYSSANRGSKDTKNDLIFMQDFKTAYALLLPDIVIAENLPKAATQAKVHEHIRELFQARSENCFSKSITINHANFTATDRERNYVVATNFQMKDINLNPKPREPEQYLFSQNAIKKYDPLRQLMTEKTKVTGLRLPIKDTELFIRTLRTYLLYKQKNDALKKHHLIISGKKCLETFPKLDGKDREDSKLQKGLAVNLRPKTGRITFTANLNGENKKKCTFERHRLMHSKYKTPTLYGNVLEFSFWDKLRAPYIPELCLMQGMSKRFTEKLILSSQRDRNFRSPSDLIAMLCHSLSPKVVTPLLLDCILQKLVIENILPERTKLETLNDANHNNSDTNNNNQNDKMKETIEPSLLSLSENIDLDQYDLVEAALYAQDQEGNILENVDSTIIYLLRDKQNRNIVSKDIFFSAKSLDALLREGYLGYYPETIGRKRKASIIVPQLIISIKGDQNESTLQSEVDTVKIDLLSDTEEETTGLKVRSNLDTYGSFYGKSHKNQKALDDSTTADATTFYLDVNSATRTIG